MDRDPLHARPGPRFCRTNTGNESAVHFGEVMCGVDADPMAVALADAEGKIAVTTEMNRFAEGDGAFNPVDNMACLPDGADRDIKSDGCIRMLSVKDRESEPTGLVFAPDGTSAFVSVRRARDDAMTKVGDDATDDPVHVTGFAKPAMRPGRRFRDLGPEPAARRVGGRVRPPAGAGPACRGRGPSRPRTGR